MSFFLSFCLGFPFVVSVQLVFRAASGMTDRQVWLGDLMQVRHPGQVRDVAAAVGWVKHSIQQFGGDPSRVVLCGHSAGAHLCMLAAAQPRCVW